MGIKMKYCTYCGAKIKEDEKYCNSCGAKYEEMSSEGMQQSSYYTAEELDIKYEDPYEEQSEYGGDVFFERPKSFSGTVGYDNQGVNGNAGNGNIGLSIASMVCGILSLVCCCLWYLGVILAIAAIVMGIISIKNKYEGKGMAIAGLVTGGITIFALVAALVMAGVYTVFEIS